MSDVAPIRVMVVDDHTLFRRGLKARLSADARFFVADAASGLQKPKRFTAYTATDLKATSNGADYIFITHGDFYTATQTLASSDELSSLKNSELSDLVKYLDEDQDAFEAESNKEA